MGKKKILFYLAQEYYWPSMEPIYRSFERSGGYELWLKLGENSKRHLYLFLISQKKKLEEKYRSLGYDVTDQSRGFDAVFCGAPINNPGQFGSALLCNVDHGPGIKTLRYRHFLEQPGTRYLCFLEGRYRVEKFKKYGLDKIEDIVDVGLPKLDCLFDGSFQRAEILSRLNLDPEKKIVLYAPSYKPTSIFEIGEAIVRLENEFNVIIKLHPYSWSGKYASHKQHRFFENLERKYKNFLLVRPEVHDILPFMYIADTMISDGSSVINEFLAMGKCGVIYDLDEKKLKHFDGQPLLEDSSSTWLKDSFIHVSQPGAIGTAIREAINPAEKRIRNIQKDRDYIFSYTDGKSSERVRETVERFLEKRK